MRPGCSGWRSSPAAASKRCGSRSSSRLGAPIDAFGVGTRAVSSADAPTFDAVYKLAAYAGRGRIKLSTEKETLPGRKQVFRRRDAAGLASGDVIARADERLEGEPLLEQVMREGGRLDAGTCAR